MKKRSIKVIMKNSIRFLLLALCGATLGIKVYFTNANTLVGNRLPMPFGYGAAVVLSGSMEPELSKGDLIIIKETDSFEYNEIVVFQDGETLVVHRIVEINDERIVTKGDANNVADEPIVKSLIRGEVLFAIPFLGSAIEFIKTPVGMILIVALAIILLEIPRRREKQKDIEEMEKIKEEIRKLKCENKE